MTGGPAIIGRRLSDDTAEPAEIVAPVAEAIPEHEYEQVAGEGYVPPSPWRTFGPALGLVVALGWVVGWLWVARDSLAVLSPVALAQFAATLIAMPALAGILWLIALRTSNAEAQRFGASARAMRAEAAALGHSVAMLSAAIDGNRAHLADQVRTLTALGDTATERLAAIGRGLSEEIDQADVHARSLSEAAHSAQATLATLLATLPRAQAETEKLAGLLDETGLTAAQHAAALDAQIVALSDRGREAEAAAGGAAQKLAAHIARMESTSETAGTRLEAVTATMSDAVDALLGRTAQAIDESRKGIAAQGDAMLAMVGANQSALDIAARESAESLAERIAIIEIVIDRIAARLDVQRATGEGLVADLESGIGRVESRLGTLHTQGADRTQFLAASISALSGSADAMTAALHAGDAMATRAIGTTESLLIALDAAAREIDETLPQAIDRLDARVAATKSVVVSAKPELLALVTAAESTHDAIEAIAQVVSEQRRSVDTLNGTLLETLDAGRAKADAMGQMVDEAADRATRFAAEAAPKLIETLMRVRDTASAAADHARETLSLIVPEASAALEASGSAALRRAVEAGLDLQIAQIATAADVAVASATRAADRLTQQMQAIDATIGAIDSRVDLARAERDAHETESFARRASVLIEAMNSAAIDITRTFAPDVADSAWASYLKGDRGVFTRRAVRLLDATEQRDILRLYDDDWSFRDQVNRYIHDFEAMLRTILAQRDGSPLGVTLLSSDMGKLYVALAQAIERLR